MRPLAVLAARREASTVGGVELGERCWTRAQLGLAEAVERGLDGVQQLVQIVRIGLDIQ